MHTPRALAALLNGIVISSLGACGGTAEGDHAGSVSQGSGGDAVSGSSAGGTGSAGHQQMAGGNAGGSSGGMTLIAMGGAVGTGGAAVAGNGAGGNVSKLSMPLCEQQVLRFVEGLHLPEPVDYLGAYLLQSVSSVYQSTGTLCSGASDKAACETSFAAGTPTTGFPSLTLYPPMPTNLPSYSYMYLAYTRGDSVGFITDRAQLNAFLGEIDTANEAGLTFLSMGLAPACNAISETPDAYFYSPPFASIGCSIMPPGRLFSVTRAGQTSSTPVGMATPCVGRRPSGLSPERARSASPLGDYYASIAHLEGAAVLAFDVMERELARFGAPKALRLRAQRARADEERHHRQMAALAQRAGATVSGVTAVANGERSLFAAALENAVEGCVREAWGALSAHYQAATAADPEARVLWRQVALDESEHAELSLALHEWFMRQLTVAERQAVEQAMQRACVDLRCELAFGAAPHPVVAREAGVPEPARAAALFAELERQVLQSVVDCAA